jgi:hypothetical protein
MYLRPSTAVVITILEFLPTFRAFPISVHPEPTLALTGQITGAGSDLSLMPITSEWPTYARRHRATFPDTFSVEVGNGRLPSAVTKRCATGQVLSSATISKCRPGRGR